MESILNTCWDFCRTHGLDKTYWVGYSGGLDSHVLLYALAQLRTETPLKIRAVYINHGLSPNAGKWAEHCAAICRQLQIDFLEHAININPFNAGSPEELAREKRYELFAQLLGPQDFFVNSTSSR